MAKEDFEKRLREFFEEHDERKLQLVPKIVQKLHRHEELIMNHLHYKYNTGMARNVSEEELKEEDRIRRERESGVSESDEEAEENAEELSDDEEEEASRAGTEETEEDEEERNE